MCVSWYRGMPTGVRHGGLMVLQLDTMSLLTSVGPAPTVPILCFLGTPVASWSRKKQLVTCTCSCPGRKDRQEGKVRPEHGAPSSSAPFFPMTAGPATPLLPSSHTAPTARPQAGRRPQQTTAASTSCPFPAAGPRALHAAQATRPALQNSGLKAQAKEAAPTWSRNGLSSRAPPSIPGCSLTLPAQGHTFTF